MTASLSHSNHEIVTMQQQLRQQQTAFLASPMPLLDHRLHQLNKLKTALLNHQQALCEALHQDYGHRSQYDTLISDILPCLQQLKYTKKSLKKWLKPSKRHAGLLLAPAKVRVEYQPLGVIGIMVPWNFPVMLSISPLITALAAGNRVMLKLSELTPHTNAVLTQLLAEAFSGEEVFTVMGDSTIASAFSSLPFDHLLFTGSTQVGHHIMKAAAEHLTPVTLELGGKSPVLVAADISMKEAVQKLIYGKCLNAGQICVAPDYVLLPKGKTTEFISAYQQQFAAMYPQGANSPDYTAVINQHHYQRLQQWCQQAQQGGAHVIAAHAISHNDEQQKMVTHLVTNPADDMTVVQQEIFGPLLPIIEYEDIDQAISYVQQRPRPLALYVFSHNKALQQHIVQHTHSGGVCINETLVHVSAEDAPFGGIGPSGMGHYHGHEGFLTFSKAKTILQRGKFYPTRLMMPPYGWLHRLTMKLFLR